ncbi:hypothetical protein ACFWY9_30990 [Amycolatopsis sp. NPDC059027]|uniref:hypothetical protein n=1 Tax=Amycolatopsis sp. NPDC059027 TaxID=3346709 RepID=UPI0036711AA9
MSKWPRFAPPMLVVLGVLLVGGIVFAATRAPASDTGEAPAGAAETVWRDLQAEVTAVRPGPEPNVVVARATVPAGEPDCARSPHVDKVTEENDTVYANIVYSTRATLAREACPRKEQIDVPLTARSPIGDRAISLNSGQAWHRKGAEYGHCDEYLGCVPPADHCAEPWINQTVFSADVPVNRLHGARDLRGCDQNWLVLDLDRHVGDCPPAEGAPACQNTRRANRVFYHWAGNGWKSFAGAKDGGCAEVKAVEPEFPPALCEKLAAPN